MHQELLRQIPLNERGMFRPHSFSRSISPITYSLVVLKNLKALNERHLESANGRGQIRFDREMAHTPLSPLESVILNKMLLIRDPTTLMTSLIPHLYHL